MAAAHMNRNVFASMASVVAAVVVLSVITDTGAAQVVVTGTVAEVVAGEWLSVVNETTDPTGVRIAVRDATVYEVRAHDPALVPQAIKPGDRVTVWYRSVGERRPVADTVRVLPH